MFDDWRMYNRYQLRYSHWYCRRIYFLARFLGLPPFLAEAALADRFLAGVLDFAALAPLAARVISDNLDSKNQLCHVQM